MNKLPYLAKQSLFQNLGHKGIHNQLPPYSFFISKLSFFPHSSDGNTSKVLLIATEDKYQDAWHHVVTVIIVFSQLSRIKFLYLQNPRFISKGKRKNWGKFFHSLSSSRKKKHHLENRACLYVICLSWLNRDNHCKKPGGHENIPAIVLTQDINFKTQK